MAGSRGGPGPGGEGGLQGGLSFGAWALAAAGAHVVLGLLLFEPTPFPGGDNAGYMILGESLREGLGYRDLHLPGTPLHTKYPPLYPTALAALGWIGGLQLFKLASLAFTSAAVWLTARLGRRWLGEAPALAAAGLMAVNPVLLEYSHHVLSEALFTLLVLLSLERLDEGSGGDGALPWAATGAAAGAFLTRTAGVPLLAAIALYALVRGGRRAALSALVPAVVVAGGWALYQRVADPAGAGYLAEFAMVDPYDPASGTIGVAGLVRRTALNAWTYVSEVLPASLLGGVGSTAVLLPVGAAAAALAVAGWIGRAREEVGAAELFTLLYLALIAAWPSVWTDRRFLLPVLPLLVLYVLGGALSAARLLRNRIGGAPGPGGAGGTRAGPALAAALLLAVPAVVGSAGMVPDRLRCLAAHRAGSPCLAPALASFFEAADWARENTPEEAIFVSRKPRFFYWRGRRRGDTYRFSPEPSLVFRDIERMGAGYVVVDNLSATTPRYLVPAIERHPDRFEVVYGSGRPPTFVLRLLPAAGVGSRESGEGGGRSAPAAPAGGLARGDRR